MPFQRSMCQCRKIVTGTMIMCVKPNVTSTYPLQGSSNSPSCINSAYVKMKFVPVTILSASSLVWFSLFYFSITVARVKQTKQRTPNVQIQSLYSYAIKKVHLIPCRFCALAHTCEFWVNVAAFLLLTTI